MPWGLPAAWSVYITPSSLTPNPGSLIPPDASPDRSIASLWIAQSRTGERNDAAEVGDTGPSLREDGAGVGVDLGEADGSPAGSLEPHIESADA
jgi:hypothetical protein